MGGDADTNAAMIVGVLRGETGARRDVVLLNAAHALVVSGRFQSLPDALAAAAESLDAGRALDALRALADASHHAPTS